ncbi:MAG: hypothetical protein KC463_07385 [Streptococcus sp.]|nr:hypothetical protein [Streptococcus sp.]
MLKSHFSPFISEYGSPIDFSDYFGLEGDFLKQVEKEINAILMLYKEKYGLKEVYFSFTSSTKLKAFAGLHNQVHVIGISLGRALTLLRYFECSMTYSNILSLPNFTFSGPYVSIREPQNISQYKEVHKPHDPRRCEQASGLARLVLMFIAGHELAHLALGHLERNASQKILKWDEDSESAKTEDSKDQVVMEFTADRFASQFLLHYLMSLEGWPFILLYRYSLFGIHSLFQFDKSDGKWSEHIFSKKHPPAQFRSVASLASLTQLAISAKQVNEKEAKAESAFTMEAALKAYELITGQNRNKVDGIEYKEILDSVGNISIEMIQRHRELFPDSGW